MIMKRLLLFYFIMFFFFTELRLKTGSTYSRKIRILARSKARVHFTGPCYLKTLTSIMIYGTCYRHL